MEPEGERKSIQKREKILRKTDLWRWAAAAIFLLTVIQVFGIGFAPVRNFTRQTYGAGSQNWAVAQDPSGRVYFANRDGLLKFDGIRWNVYYLPNYTTVRSVLADEKSGRIYAGGSGEFGFFHTDTEHPTLSYVSLSALLPERERNFTEIWNILKMPGGEYAFQGDFRIFLTDGKTIRTADNNEKITSSGIIGGRLYIGTQTGELKRLEGNSLIPAAKLPRNSRIVSLLPYDKSGVLIATANDGLYLYDKGKLTEMKWDISPYLKENQAFCATCNGALYAFGTVNHGAVVKNVKTGATSHINKQTGLQNNTVLGIGFDHSANLWLCLDNGLGYAMVDSPVFNLLGNDSEAGAGYSSMLSGGNLLLATNRGLYSTRYPFADKTTPPALTRMHSGQVWSLDSVGEDIFISADDGLFVMQAKSYTQPQKIPGIETGSWYLAPLKLHPGKALVSTYSGFYIVSRERGSWKSLGRIEGYSDGGGKFVEDRDGTIWIAHWIKGVYRLVPAPDLRSFKSVKLYTSKEGLPSERENNVSICNGKVLIATASGAFFTPDRNGRLQRDEEMTARLPLHHSTHLYALPSGSAIAFSPKSVWKISDLGGDTKIDSVSLHLLASSLIPGFEHIGMIDESNMIVAHQEGFFNVDLNGASPSKWKTGVFVESLTSGDSIIFSGLTGGEKPDLKLPYSQNSLNFTFAAPEYRYENAVLYSCFLDNYDKEWSTPSDASSKEYTQLSEGNYTLRIRAFNTITGETAETEFSFTILPPWYRSTPAKIIYGLLIILLIYAGYRLFRYLSQKNARKMKEQKEAEMETMKREAEKDAIKKDYEIASLKSEQLERDIKHKSSELSNTTMNVIRKNEILLDISSRLNKLQDNSAEEETPPASLHKEIDKIQNLIHDNISHDDDWKKFHQNFDIVYADFTTHLAELHPNLTVAEKRLCCYLKMGLSSKEIAPIFSISPKSVEMNRYRLRAKLGLKRENNLVEYLQGI